MATVLIVFFFVMDYTCQLKNQGDGQICMLRFTDEKKYLVHKLQKHQDQEDDAEYN